MHPNISHMLCVSHDLLELFLVDVLISAGNGNVDRDSFIFHPVQYCLGVILHSYVFRENVCSSSYKSFH